MRTDREQSSIELVFRQCLEVEEGFHSALHASIASIEQPKGGQIDEIILVILQIEDVDVLQSEHDFLAFSLSLPAILPVS